MDVVDADLDDLVAVNLGVEMRDLCFSLFALLVNVALFPSGCWRL